MFYSITPTNLGLFSKPRLGKPSKKINSGYNEFGIKGGGVSDLNHYLKQLWNSEKGGGAKAKRSLHTAEN